MGTIHGTVAGDVWIAAQRDFYPEFRERMHGLRCIRRGRINDTTFWEGTAVSCCWGFYSIAPAL
jgi:hypothetical protein